MARRNDQCILAVIKSRQQHNWEIQGENAEWFVWLHRKSKKCRTIRRENMSSQFCGDVRRRSPKCGNFINYGVLC